MRREFIPYEQALALKALGFDEPCFGIWIESTELSISSPEDDEYCQKQHEFPWTALAPLYQQAFRWFRENHDLDIIDRPHIGKTKKYVCDPVNIRLEAKNTYKEAELACLVKLIKIVKNK